MQSNHTESGRALELRAMDLTLDLRVDHRFDEAITSLPDSPILTAYPWLLCYQAMEYRLVRGDYAAVLQTGQAALAQFKLLGNVNGQARALAEVAIAHYFLGQYTTALTLVMTAPSPTCPACIAALALAACVNHVGQGALEEAVRSAQRGLHALTRESNVLRRATWRIVLQRNAAVAYHFQGHLTTARQSAEAALCLAEQYRTDSYLYDWSLYELGLLEQRAGQLDRALTFLRRVHARVEHAPGRDPIWRWSVVAKGHTLRDQGLLEAADACYRRAGCGEGEDGPLMLWLLQGRRAEARCAAEARLVGAYASESQIEVINLTVFLALLALESGATAEARATLHNAVEQYVALGFHYHRASAQLHLAAAAYALGNEAAGDRMLTEALRFGAARGYLNFAWWHAARMRTLLRRALQIGVEPEYSSRLLHERGLEPAASATVTMQLRCLGQFEVRVNGHLLPQARWQGGKAGALRMQRLLLFLARQRAPQPLDAIARYVWPDTWEQIRVPDNFHLTLAGLRRVLEPDLDQGSASRFVLTTSQGYQLHPGLAVTLDLDQLQAAWQRARIATARGDHVGARAAFTEVEQRYTGDFALARPDPLEAETYRHMLLEALRWLAADDLHRGELAACIARARRLLREDRWDTVAPVLLIRAYLAQGNRRAARRQYEQYRTLHGEVPPELADLARRHGL